VTERFLDLEDVSLVYDLDGTLAVEHLSLRVKRGEFVAVVGPSGCGKSTLLKLVSGLVPPTSGVVLANEREVAGPQKIVGMAFQNPTLLPWRTTLQNVMLPLEVVDPHRKRLRRERKRYEEKARALLERVGLDGFEDKFPWQLSGGMQQRASLCRALIHEPQLLMLDEPFGALDAFTREELWCVLAELRRQQGITVVLVTHDLREAVFLADTVFVLSKRPGRVVLRREIDLPPERGLDICYGEPFMKLVHELRDHIVHVREN
jgi:NitT/TauT family transport system ATP-binding protein